MSDAPARVRIVPLCCSLLCALAVVLAVPAAAAGRGADNGSPRSAAAIDAATDLDASAIRERIAVVEARTDVPQAERDLVLKQLHAAVTRVEAAETARQASAQYSAALQSAPETIAALNAESVAPPPPVQAPKAHDNPVQMQLALASLQAEAVSLRSKQRNLEESLRSMSSRPDEARSELSELHRQLNQQQVEIPGNAGPLLVEASKLLNGATRQELSARIDRTEQELLSLPTRESIANAQHALTARRSTRIDKEIGDLSERITAQREHEAKQQTMQALAFARKLADQPQPLRDYADRNAEIRESLKQVNERLVQARTEQQALRVQQAEVSEARKNADQILAIGRISNESGHLLRELQGNLVASDTLASRIAAHEDALVDAQVKRLQVRQELRALQPADRAAQRYLQAHALAVTDANVALMTSLIEKRHAALSDLDTLQGQLVAVLAEAKAMDSQLMQGGVQLRTLLDEHLLWLPSAVPLGRAWFRQLGNGVVWLVAASNWSGVSSAIASTLRTQWFKVIVWLGVLIGLLAFRPRLTTSLQALARPVGTRGDRFLLTLMACGVTVLLTLTWPLWIAAAAWLLRSSAGQGSFPRALAQGLSSVAVVWFMLGLFIDMCRAHGVFAAHFGWGERGTQRLSRALRLLLFVLVPTAMLIGMTHASGRPELINGIGRLGFVIGSLALALFLYRVFRLRGGALTGGLNRNGLAMRTRKLWTSVLVAMPLLLVGLAAGGYYATARELQSRLFTSGWIVLAVVIALFVAMRGVVVASRRTAWKQADERRARVMQESAEDTESDEGRELLTLQNQEADIDAISVSQQTRTLLRAISSLVLLVLLWGIWSSLIPALNVFNDIALWSHVVTTAAGATMAVVTLGDVLFGLLILVLAVIAARNLPGFLEITVLQHLDIDSGTRYAIGTIGRYLLLGVGLVMVFSRIGADWSQLQWIVAALGVGLGFGLQEIVANFISGLIILFERPVRVGDLVSIGPTTGTVSRIKIRAITITDFDNFEVIVPNKSFITETVQNWSLTNEVTRLLIVIRIAYGSDVEQAQQIILDVATANEHVLASPAPSAWFLRFGEHALEFELRAYVQTIDERLSTQHALHVAMNAQLKAAGIEVLFPQRDVQVRRSEAAPSDS